jgi:hypothetical protein
MQIRANRDGVRWVNRGAIEFDVLDNTALIDHESSASRKFVFVAAHRIFLQNAVIREHFAVHIAEQREGDVNLLGKSGVGGWAVCANSENNGVGGFDFG